MDPSAISTQVGIITLNGGVYTANVDAGVKYIALKLVSGVVTYAGSIALQGVVPPSTASDSPQTLDSTGFEISAENPIDGFIVDASLGVVIIAFTK